MQQIDETPAIHQVRLPKIVPRIGKARSEPMPLLEPEPFGKEKKRRLRTSCALIRINANPRAPPVVIISMTRTVVGRADDCDFRIDTPQDDASWPRISKHHAEIIVRRRHSRYWYILKDCESTNGVFVQGKRITLSLIHNGDEICFGPTGGRSAAVGEKISTRGEPVVYRFWLLPPMVMFDPGSLDVVEDPGEPKFCHICYDVPAEGIRIAGCDHVYCASCFDRWAQVTALTRRALICPVCRREVIDPDVELERIELKRVENELHVISVRELLLTLRVPSCRSVRHSSILKVWQPAQQLFFEESMEALQGSEFRMVIFLHLTQATAARLLRAEDAELRNACTNLQVVPNGEGPGEMIAVLLQKIYGMLYRNYTSPTFPLVASDPVVD